MGSLSILNAGAGDLKLSFNKRNKQEAEHAKVVIVDMLRRGYALFVEENGEYIRVNKFDPQRGVYVITNIDTSQEQSKTPTSTRKRGQKTLPMEETTAVAVARSAGG